VIPEVIVTVAVAKAVVSTVLVATTRIGFVDGTAGGALFKGERRVELED